jgi:hypothetical protein
MLVVKTFISDKHLLLVDIGQMGLRGMEKVAGRR